MILNLGCGELPIKDTINIDCYHTGHEDEIVDLTKFPWKWQDNSIDGILMFHSLEHFQDTFRIINECHRILKVGGSLFIVSPHSSSISSIGNMTHYHAFSYGTFSFYLKNMFRTEIDKVLWISFERNNNNQFGIKFKVSQIRKYNVILRIINQVIQRLVDLSPRAFERLWCFYVGGASEVVWKGVKL